MRGKRRWCHFKELHAWLLENSQLAAESPMHGVHHWKTVERNGVWISRRSGADFLIIRLFAWLHDSQRWDDGADPEHGARAAEVAYSLQGHFYELDEYALNTLAEACRDHTHVTHTENNIIATCWDADRLDLGRVGIPPDPAYMNTNFGREVAEAGGFTPLLNEDEMDEIEIA